MKKVTQKALSLLLSLVMLFGMVQGAAVPAFAAGTEGVTAYYCDSGLFKDSNWTDGPVGSSGTENVNFRKTITNVEIKDSTSVIGDNALSNCTVLQSVNIPESVTNINQQAFGNCKALTSVTIPQRVTSISRAAFLGCEKLAVITVDEKNPSYRSDAGVLFTKDGKTLTVYPMGKAGTGYTVPAGVTSIGESAFRDCTGLQSVSIPAGVTSIGAGAFYKCTALTSVSIPASVTTIGSTAFSSCSGLQSITIPTSVTTISYGVFYGCAGLQSVTIPASVTTISDKAFSYCSNLTEVTFESATPPETVGSSVFDECGSLTAIYVPDEAAAVRYQAVTNFSAYTNKIKAPEAVAKDTFFTAGVLRYKVTDADKKTVEVAGNGGTYTGNITVPERVAYKGNSFSVTGIGGVAFDNCTGLESVSIPTGVTSIGQNAFFGCTGLQNVTIPANVTAIGEYAFFGCTGLQGVTFAEGSKLTAIGNSAFSGCAGLQSVSIPAGVTSIGDRAFANSSKLTEIAVDANNKNYGSVDGILFNIDKTALLAYPAGKAGTSYAIPAGVTTIDQSAFRSCTALTSVTIPASVTTIGSQVFRNCTALTSVIIPAGVTSIGNAVFYDCTGLVDVMFESTEPSQITTLGDIIFQGCANFTVWVPGVALEGYKSTFDPQYQDIIKAAETVAKDTEFTGGSLEYKVTDADKKTVEVSGLNKTYSGNLSIPEKVAYMGNVFSVTSIESSATADCNGLTGVTIPSGVTSIGKGAFANNSKLTEIAVDANNKNYSSADGILFNKDKTTLVAYPASKAGTSYTIPAGVMSIGDGAFCGCTALTGVTVPAGVTSIGMGAFANSSTLTEIAVDANNKNYSSVNGVLFNKNKTTLLTYPAGRAGTSYTVSAGVTAIGDGAFSGSTALTGVTIPAGVTSIGEGTFFGCAGLQSVSIPSGVTSIGKYVFYGCAALTSVTIPSGVTSIGNSAFMYCAALTGITIPAGVTAIDDNAFDSCTALTNVTIPASVTSIGEEAFYECYKLTGVTLKGKVTSVGTAAFNEDDGASITFAVLSENEQYYKALLNSDVMGNTTANFAVIRLVTAITNLPAATSVAAGTALGALNLPASLTVTVGGAKETVNVTWSSSPEYDSTLAGIYTFTPNLPNGYVPDDGVNATYKVTVKPAVVVSGVTVTPSAVSVQKGSSYSFTAKVEGSNSSQSVTWSVSGNQSQSTVIDQNGKLTVAADETAATVSVKATSTDDTAKYGTAVVTVTTPSSDNGGSGDSGNSGGSGKNHSSSTVSTPSIPSIVTANGNAAGTATVNATADLSGASFPSGVTGVAFSVTPETSAGIPQGTSGSTADPQGAAAYRLAVSNDSLNLIGSPFVYSLKLLDQNGNPITGFTGTVKVRIPLPAGLRGTPRVFRYEADGTLTDMKAAVENGFLVFSTDHFSYYVIAGSGDSITLDTKNYLMPVNGSYQVGVKLTGGKAASVKFRSTNGKTATVTKLKNGNYQVTGKNLGTAYIMFDVYDNKNKLLTHASVRVDVKTGIRPRGDSARQIGLY